MLTVEEIQKIMIDFFRKRAPRVKGKEADELRRQLEKEIPKMERQGLQVDLPEEWPDIGE